MRQGADGLSIIFNDAFDIMKNIGRYERILSRYCRIWISSVDKVIAEQTMPIRRIFFCDSDPI